MISNVQHYMISLLVILRTCIVMANLNKNLGHMICFLWRGITVSMLCISFLVGALSGSEFAPFLMDNMCVICNRLSFIYKQQQAFRERQTSAEYLKLICPKALILKFSVSLNYLPCGFYNSGKAPQLNYFCSCFSISICSYYQNV